MNCLQLESQLQIVHCLNPAEELIKTNFKLQALNDRGLILKCLKAGRKTIYALRQAFMPKKVCIKAWRRV